MGKAKKPKPQMPNHVNLVPNMKNQMAYKHYRVSGGEADYETWKKENKK